jgi:hypothetical protein
VNTPRHSTTIELLHHGIDQSVILLWLGSFVGGFSISKVLPVATPTQAGSLCYTNTVAW